MLTNEEKRAVVEGHIKQLEVEKYNVDVLIEAENSLPSPTQETLDYFNALLNNINTKMALLQSKLAELSD
jgi:hypothetical protein